LSAAQPEPLAAKIMAANYFNLITPFSEYSDFFEKQSSARVAVFRCAKAYFHFLGFIH